MKKISLCLIVKNEEKNLNNCLINAQEYADEIVVVDTGSVDKTKEIAKRYTDKVYDFKWEDDFSKARNFAFDKAKCEYLMWMDADDIILSESVDKIKEWKNSGEDCDVLMCKYVASFDENYNPLFEYYRERIVKNSKKLRWRDRVHEVITPNGKICYNDKILIFHNKKTAIYSDRNLNIYQLMIEKGEIFSPRNKFYYARELFFNGKYKEAIHQFSKFLADDKGWIENKIEACLNLAKCFQAEGEERKALSSLFGSFVYDKPRGEILYAIGSVFIRLKEYNNAIFWLKLALNSQERAERGAFVDKDCYTFLPAISLCMCYSRLGDDIEAYKYHQIAKTFKPNDERVKYNQLYFDNLFKNEKCN